MPATRRSGVRTRPLPDWYSSDLSAAYQVLAACPGHFQVFGLYNNATDGSVLKVYAVEIYSDTTIGINFSSVDGKAGGTVTTTWGPIDPTLGKPPGLPITVGSTVQLGTNFGGIEAQQNTPRFFAPGWPFAIVRPNKSFLLQPAQQ